MKHKFFDKYILRKLNKAHKLKKEKGIAKIPDVGFNSKGDVGIDTSS